MGQDRWTWRVRRSRAESSSSPDCPECQPSKPVQSFHVTASLPPTVLDSDVPRHAGGTLHTALDDLIVVLRKGYAHPYLLNATAAMIWQTIDGSRDVTAIIQRLAGDMGTTTASIAGDVRSGLADLHTSGLIDLRDSEAPIRAQSSTAGDQSRPDVSKEDWRHAIGPLAVAGTSLVLRVADSTLAARSAAFLADLPRVTAPADVQMSVREGVEDTSTVVIDVDRPPRSRMVSSEHMEEVLLSEMNLVAAAGGSGRAVLHAGAVERDGQVVVVTGPSGAGKSTLVAALMRRGFRYVTDEAVAIDVDSLTVLPYPKPLSLDARALSILGHDHPVSPLSAPSRGGADVKISIPASQLGAISPGGQVAVLVLLTENPSTGDPSRPVEDLLELLASAFPSMTDEPRSLDALGTLVDELPVLRLARTPIDEACDRIMATLP